MDLGLGGKVAAFGRQPSHGPGRDLVEKARCDIVPELPVKHAALRMRQVQPAPRARNRHISQAALLFDAVVRRRVPAGA